MEKTDLEQLDSAYHPLLTPFEIYMAGGYGWFIKQQNLWEKLYKESVNE